MRPGDFTSLADDYTKYRPSYNALVTKTIINSTNTVLHDIKAADVGAGTGIFTKCLADAGILNIKAVEPNDEMRNAGQTFLGKDFDFSEGTAERTGLLSKSCDLVTMASSFHWPNTEKALKEFDRILSDDGVFCALWNPRLTEKSDCENEVQQLLAKKYNVVSRVSSGLSGVTQNLREILSDCKIFKSVMYVDAVDIIQRTQEEYIGAWRSVNDVQTQLGKKKFKEFLDDINKIVSKRDFVEVHYLTRAWIACK